MATTTTKTTAADILDQAEAIRQRRERLAAEEKSLLEATYELIPLLEAIGLSNRQASMTLGLSHARAWQIKAGYTNKKSVPSD